MKRSHIKQLLFTIILLALSLLVEVPVYATPPIQEGDPCAQCAEGHNLFLDYRDTEALPLLEAAFAGRENAACANTNEMGNCALALGIIRDGMGDETGALEAFTVALEIFRSSGNRSGEGTTLYRIGLVYQDMGHYAQALGVYQQALPILREADNQERERDTLTSIGEVYWAQKRYDEALEVYRQALVVAFEVGDRAAEGPILSRIGNAYRVLEHHAAALEAYQQALAIVRELGNQAGEGAALASIGTVYYDQERYAEALEAYQQALDILRQVGNWADAVTVLMGIGEVYRVQGRYKEALATYEQALAINREMHDRTGEAFTLDKIGLMHYAQGRYGEAMVDFEQALVILREGGDRAVEGATIHNIAGVYQAQGRYGEALATLEQALAIRRQVGDRAGEGTTLNGIGVVYRAQGRYEEALVTLEQALAIRREAGDLHGEAITLSNIGGIYYRLGRYGEAVTAYEQALAIDREVGNRPAEGVTLSNLGLVYCTHGHYEGALAAYEQALVIMREAGNRADEGTTLTNMGGVYYELGRYEEALAAHKYALAVSREVGNWLVEGIALNNIGLVYGAQGQAAEALDAYQQAMETLEAVRSESGSEQARTALIAQYADLYIRAVALFHQQGQDEKAFFTSERGRARAFLDSMATGQVQLSDSVAAELLVQEQEAYAQRQAVQDALAKARVLSPPDPKLVADLEKQLAEAETVYDKTLKAVEAHSDQLAALVPGRSTEKTILGVSQVQALLDEQTTIISYFVLENQTLAFLITHDSFQTVALDVSRKELITQITAFRDFPTDDLTSYPDSAVTLYNQLVVPIKEYLTTPHLAIVPHNILHYLPFAALTDGERYYLIDDYVLTTLPSASSLPFIQENTGRELVSPLILGNPVTDPELGLRPLISARQEAQAIAALYDVQPLLGEAATETAVKERASQAGILHLAAHGEFKVEDPLDSPLYLAPDDQNDGQLKVGEVYGLDLRNADLIVLSACQTLLGHDLEAGKQLGVTLGDEIIGLSRAFIYAGTPSVISTLWKVDSQSTEMLMERFYTYLREGMGKAEAMRQAQIDMRAKYPNPYFWSGFVLSGDGGAGKMSGYKPSARETATPLPSAEATTVPVGETPKAEEAPTPAKGGGPCPAGALILALGVGVAFIATGRGARHERHHLSEVADQG